ncbi:PP2C family serine/threonine-protein phosphatase [Amycolatopsis sp. WQ 127309]|uniref:PP2C family protein-serine/threonine phosphatase n=1 Tax=Amycolatopsis sp. WQ 127309 TaxID=2932773 RepID=UPI001FF15F89|nr:protein phosphatase 2C domain-containing protein [Amycolatopsis sp. WQ 127309]UOZ07776.1 protein phosphatase 2C domain-containing protein [Amycolatopsis sp. WQ 127309]
MTGHVTRAAAGSDVGRRYSANFDVVHLTEDPLLAVVADGMGDGEGSRMAGRTAVDVFVAGAGDSADSLREAVASAQRQVTESGGGHWLVQIGDSRAYRLRDGLLELLTTDHTMAWLGAVNGWYAFDSPQASAARYQLTRYIGHPAHPEPDVLSLALRPGDVLLLCSDGVAEQVPYERIREILGRLAPPDEQVRQLLAVAEEAGGQDNATAVVVQVA